MPGPKRTPAVERFPRFFERGNPDECWIWQGGTMGNGYGQFYDDEHSAVGAHRFAWAIANDRSIPKGLQVMHSCDTPPCVNPAHLSVGTCQENQQDSANKGRNPGNRTSRGGPAPKFAPAVIAALRDQGLTYREIGTTLGISQATAWRTLRRVDQ